MMHLPLNAPRGRLQNVCIATWLLALVLASGQTTAQTNFGKYRGDIVVKLLQDGRNVQVVQAFAYQDPAGKEWQVPAGTITDGASIPHIFWITHPPFTGRYRDAAVVHDHHCRVRSSNWKDVHMVFYNAMRASGVDERTAKVMYAAVYNFGPRWGADTGRRGVPAQNDAQQKVFMEAIDAWVQSKNPSPDEIAKVIDTGRIPQ